LLVSGESERQGPNGDGCTEIGQAESRGLGHGHVSVRGQESTRRRPMCRPTGTFPASQCWPGSRWTWRATSPTLTAFRPRTRETSSTWRASSEGEAALLSEVRSGALRRLIALRLGRRAFFFGIAVVFVGRLTLLEKRERAPVRVLYSLSLGTCMGDASKILCRGFFPSGPGGR
jgi:hypothetical protein